MPDQPTPDSPQPSPSRPGLSSNDWLSALLGLALIAYGIYLMMNSGWTSYLGPLLVLVGVAFQPWVLVSITGGAALLGWAVWWTFFKALGPGDYLYSVIAFVIGLGAIIERGRGLGGLRRPK